MIGSILGGIGSIIGSIGGIVGTNKTNKTNKRLAENQMQFEERMSNTALQRGMKDAKAAGINPMYVFGNGYSASTPAGTTAQQLNEGEQWANISNAMTAFQNLMNLKKEGKLIESQQNKTDAETKEIKQRIKTNKPQETVAEGVENYLNKMKESIKVAGKKIEEILVKDKIKNKSKKTTAEKEKEYNKKYTKQLLDIMEKDAGMKLTEGQKKRIHNIENKNERAKIVWELIKANYRKIDREREREKNKK